MLTFTGAGLTPIVPVTGAVMVSRAGYGADALVNVAARDPRVYKALTRMLRYSAWGQLAMFAGVVSMAVAVDAGQLQPDNLVVQRMIGQEVEDVLKARSERITAEAAHRNGQAGAGFGAWASPAEQPTG